MKHCLECECVMPDDHDGDVCEVCRDERENTVSDCLRGGRYEYRDNRC